MFHWLDVTYSVITYPRSVCSMYAIFCPESANCLAYNVLPALLAYSRLCARIYCSHPGCNLRTTTAIHPWHAPGCGQSLTGDTYWRFHAKHLQRAPPCCCCCCCCSCWCFLPSPSWPSLSLWVTVYVCIPFCCVHCLNSACIISLCRLVLWQWLFANVLGRCVGHGRME